MVAPGANAGTFRYIDVTDQYVPLTLDNMTLTPKLEAHMSELTEELTEQLGKTTDTLVVDSIPSGAPPMKPKSQPLVHTRIQCGHKFIPGQTPRHANCERCWFLFFQTHGELTASVDAFFQEHGESALRQVQGKKFTKNFLKFMSTLARWKAAQEAGTVNGESRP